MLSMPSLRLFKTFSHHQHPHNNHHQDDCSCSCHTDGTKSFSAPRWLSRRIRRRSSTSSEQTYVVSYEEELNELIQAYEFAEDEVKFRLKKFFFYCCTTLRQK